MSGKPALSLIVRLALLATLAGAAQADHVDGIWVPTGGLHQGRALHTATRLPDGQVLVEGGVFEGSYLSSTELYDPATGQWTVTGSLGAGRTDDQLRLRPRTERPAALPIDPQGGDA